MDDVWLLDQLGAVLESGEYINTITLSLNRDLVETLSPLDVCFDLSHAFVQGKLVFYGLVV